MSDDLKPCPFCGGTNVKHVAGDTHWVYCDDCGLVGPHCSNGQRASSAWNTRPSEEALRAEVERLTRERDEAREALVKALHEELADRKRRKSEAEAQRLQRAHAEWVKRADEEVDALRVETKRLTAERDEARAEVDRLRDELGRWERTAQWAGGGS